MQHRLSLFLLLALSFSLPSQVILTGIVDGTGSSGGQGGFPRALELYVNGTADLSGFTIVRYTNGNTSSNATINLSGTYTDAFVYVINDRSTFEATFGNSGDFNNQIISGDVNGNGNDVFELRQGATVIDQTGGVLGDGSNLYQDGYLYRNTTTGPDGDWVAANWTAAQNVLDNLSFTEIGATVPFGTYSATPPGPMIAVVAESDLAEPDTDGAFRFEFSPAPAQAVTITYNLTGTATLGEDYQDPQNGSVTIAAGDSSVSLTLEIIEDTAIEPTERINLTISLISDTTYISNSGATLQVIDDDATGTFPISAIQGDGFTSPFEGETVTVQGIVVGDFQGGDGEGLGGFYVQEEEGDQDIDSTTAEGLWVFQGFGEVTPVELGDRVTVTAEVNERDGLTQLLANQSGAEVTVVDQDNPLPSPVSLDLPVTDELIFEAKEGMRVLLNGDATVTEFFELGRFGQILVSGDSLRLEQFTECNEPDAAGFMAFRERFVRNRLYIDDTQGGQNNFPVILPDGSELSPSNTLRAGSRVTGLIGVLEQRVVGSNATEGYRLQPTDYTGAMIVNENPRPTAAPEVGGSLRIVSANVLNYFTTLGGNSSEARGAADANEFERQKTKIVAGLCELAGDIVGLVEIENNNGAALQDLVDALNAECSLSYDYVRSPNTGDDDIQVALIYRTGRVTESGTAAALDSPANVFVGERTNRVPVAQTFQLSEDPLSGAVQEVTVVVNHFKSKGSPCGDGDDDTTEGSGNCNGTRTAAANAILDWLDTNPTGARNGTGTLVIGDLNAYRNEEPIDAFINEGYFNAVLEDIPAGAFPCGGESSFVFSGQWGSLDYALASEELQGQITGATAWSVNAAEPSALDYTTRFNDASLYAPDFYRFSDHDPIVIGLELDFVSSVANDPLTNVELIQTNGRTLTFRNLPRGASYSLINPSGAVVRQGDFSGSEATIRVDSIPMGIYYLSLRTATGEGLAYGLLIY